MGDDLRLVIRVAVWIVAVVMLAIWLTGCATGPVTMCSRYPCEWSKPVVRKPPGSKPPSLTESVKAYLCMEPTRAYPVMPDVTCI